MPKPKASFIIPKAASIDKGALFIDKNVSLLSSDFAVEGNSAKVFLSLRFIQSNYQRFSEWDKMDMNCFWKFNKDIHEYTWQQVLNTSGKKDKSGLAYTEIPKIKYPNPEFKNTLSNDITLFELRLSSKIRVHGFRHKSILYLCWLDRNHKITE
jgi:hypothetical protein